MIIGHFTVAEYRHNTAAIPQGLKQTDDEYGYRAFKRPSATL